MFTKPLELLIHRLGSPKCVVARISGCPDIFDVKRNFVVTVRRTGTFLVIYKRHLTLSRYNIFVKLFLFHVQFIFCISTRTSFVTYVLTANKILLLLKSSVLSFRKHEAILELSDLHDSSSTFHARLYLNTVHIFPLS